LLSIHPSHANDRSVGYEEYREHDGERRAVTIGEPASPRPKSLVLQRFRLLGAFLLFVRAPIFRTWRRLLFARLLATRCRIVRLLLFHNAVSTQDGPG
jgi:hypothetical protein